MKYSIAISPCPNDTFIFYALIHQKIKLEDIDLLFSFKDIEELNLATINQNFDLCKISYALVPKIAQSYNILSAGGALGNGCGPLLISHEKGLTLEPIHTVVLPGENTTAYALFRHFYPNINKTAHQLFSKIEPALQQRKYDAGVIIHEGRFTYSEKDLFLITDLGSLWEKTYQLPIPLGGIVIKNRINLDIQHQINDAIVKSIEYAWANVDEVLTYCKSHAQELSKEVMMSHIELYVNKFSLNIGIEGKHAVKKLFAYQRDENSCNFASEIKFID